MKYHPSDPVNVRIERITYNLRRLCGQFGVPEHMLREMTIEQVEDRISHSLLFQLRTWIASQDGKDINVPKTWWDHFKERWFPVWLLTRYPAQYRTYVARAYFPEIDTHPRPAVIRWEDFQP